MSEPTAGVEQVAATEQNDKRKRGKGSRGPNQKRKSWFIVLNNPRNFIYTWYKTNRIDPPEYILGMEQPTMAMTLARILCPEDSEDDIGVAVNVEEGEKTGTEHCHIVYYNPNGVRFNAVRRMFYNKAHIEEQQGTKTEALDYLNKRGKWEDDPKQHTLKVPPIMLGLPLGDNRKSKAGDDIERINDMVHDLFEKGYSPDDIGRAIAAEGVKEAGKSEQATKMANALLFTQANEEGRLGADGEKMFVVWHFGSGGVGKTHSLRDLTRDRTRKVHLIDPSIKDHPWDRYNYQPMVVWDDLRDTHLAYDTMLAYMNREGKGQVEGDARYFSRPFAFCRFDITSINSPEKLWVAARQKREDQGQAEPLYQLTRRINLIVYHFEDLRWPEEDANHWCAVAIRGGRHFKHGDQLVRLSNAYLEDPKNGPKRQESILGTSKPSSSEKALFAGPSDVVERKIRVMMWKAFEKDPHRDAKLAFLGLTEEEIGPRPSSPQGAVPGQLQMGGTESGYPVPAPQAALTMAHEANHAGAGVNVPAGSVEPSPATQLTMDAASTAGSPFVLANEDTVDRRVLAPSSTSIGHLLDQIVQQSASPIPVSSEPPLNPGLMFDSEDDEVPIEVYEDLARYADANPFDVAEFAGYPISDLLSQG